MLSIEWSRAPDLPQGFQDSDGGVLDGSLVTVGGFCSGGLEEDQRRKPGKYPRGFLRKGWALDLSAMDRGWQPLPEFPGAARQGLSAALANDALWYWGGFSYDAPYSYADGWRLSRRDGEWTWDRLPDLPWKNATVAMTVIGDRIYAFGGADYNAQAFFSETDRSGAIRRMGARLLFLKTDELATGWRELPECPGTPRWVNSFAAVGGRLYVIGGASGDVKQNGVSYGYCTIVDNWRFDPATSTWSRLVDLPVSSGNFPRSSHAVYRDRYILLPGGHQYAYVLNPDGTVRSKYGAASRKNPGSGLHNDVFVYDTHAERFGTADALPIDNNLPMTVVHGDEIYLLGGETGGGFVEGDYYGHHPDLCLRGRISEVVGEQR
jgi:N-acetylneuraminic acid mutarotase